VTVACIVLSEEIGVSVNAIKLIFAYYVDEQEEEIEADKIFVTSSLAEAMYLLEQCTDLAINNVSFQCLLKNINSHTIFVVIFVEC
jgi:hypothetical protein